MPGFIPIPPQDPPDDPPTLAVCENCRKRSHRPPVDDATDDEWRKAWSFLQQPDGWRELSSRYAIKVERGSRHEWLCAECVQKLRGDPPKL